MSQKENSNKKDKNDIRYYKSNYRERHRFWAGQTLTQFGNSNNFFIVIGFAIIGFLIKELNQFDKIEFISSWEKINPKVTFLIISLIFTFLSLISGILTMLSRLYDLRLTRHINTIRIKLYSKKYNFDNNLPNEYIDIKNNSKFPGFQIKLFKFFLGSILYNDYFLSEKDIEIKSNRDERFSELRERAVMLGRFSWISFKWQILWILLSIIIFMIFWK